MSTPTPSRRANRSRRGAASTPAHQPAAPRRASVPAARPIAPDADADNPFVALGVPARLAGRLVADGIAEPFPIQTATLPDTLAGRDVLGRGKTGSGKTLAFSIPLVAGLAGDRSRPRQPRGLVLVPTRELANQVLAVIEPLAHAAHLTAAVVFGGVGQNPQVRALQDGVDILIACPGRLEDLINQGHCALSAVTITVLDEADHMADLGFLPGVKRLLDRTPDDGQRMLFSATLDNGVDVLVKRYLDNPVTHSVDPAVAPVATMTHHVFSVTAADKQAVVRELASGQERSLLFMRTKHTAKRLARQLTLAGIPAVELHGNLSQNMRERNLAAFTEGRAKVMVATDIAARGIHVDDVALVVHVDPPTEHKAYLHRSGRTARAGAGGAVVTLALPEQQRDVATLARQAGIKPALVNVRPGSEEIADLTGPLAAYVAPPADAPEVPAARPESNGRGGYSTRSSSGASHRAGGAGGSGARTRGAAGSGGAPSGAGRGRSGAPAGAGARSGAPRSSGKPAGAGRGRPRGR